jgi:hypothetical protein
VPTTDIVVVDPGGGGDYTSFVAAEAAEKTDLQVADKNIIFRLRGGSGSVGIIVIQDEATWNPDATHTITIEAESGSEHEGVIDLAGAPVFVDSAAATSVDVRTTYTTLKNFIIHSTNTGPSSDTVVVITPTGSPTTVFQNMIIRMPTGTSTQSCVSMRGSGRFVNCVCMGGANSFQVEFVSTGHEQEIFNCTFVGDTRGCLINDAQASVTISDCYFHGRAQQGILVNAGSASQTRVATSDTTGTPAGLHNIPFSGVTFASVTDEADFDPHVADTSSALYDAGADISASNGGLTEDYEGGDRDAAAAGTTWDIGADEFGVARGAVAAVLDITKRNLAPIHVAMRRGPAGGVF